MNPTATIIMESSASIHIELLPDSAPNTVDSFIRCVQKGVYNNHPIERIVPGNWIDMSYKGFSRVAGRYLIPYESRLHPEIEALESRTGSVCMGGYDELGLAGSEFFITLRDCPEHKGIYPVFGRVVKGMEEVERLGKVPVRPVKNYPTPGIEVNEPVSPEVIVRIDLELNGYICKEPVTVNHSELPECWTMDW